MAYLTHQQAFNLAMEHHSAGRLTEAGALYRQLLALDPGNTGVLNLLGLLEYHCGNLELALELMERSVATHPREARYYLNLATVLIDLGRTEEAAAASQNAIAIEPRSHLAFYNLGLSRQRMRENGAAIAAYREALRLDPSYRLARLNLGVVYHDEGRLDDAILEYRRILQLHPTDADASNNLGNALKGCGLLDEAIDAYRQAIRFNPQHFIAHSNLIYTLHFHPAFGVAELHEENLRWNAVHARPLQKHWRPHANPHDPSRRLKVGYVSPHFCSHVASYFVLPLLREHDRRQFEIHAYSSVNTPDETTRRFQETEVEWHDVRRLSDEALAERIRADGIDVLIDLTMHMEGSRLRTFALRPAPVQMTWLAYPGGTGLNAIDYRISDPRIDPLGENDSFFAEETIRLPDCWFCYDPITALPPVGPLPSLTSGHITFGSLNNFCKVSAEVLKCWARLLNAVPASRLILLCPPGSPQIRLKNFFRDAGIDASRVEFVASQSRNDYLEIYHRIDLALDPFPYNGITTTCDALWMGVPVLTLPGRSPVSRAGLSLMTAAGLPEFIANSEDGYLALATAWASDAPHLARIRSTLRERVQHSPLGDAARFTRGMETAFRQMWSRWVAKSNSKSSAP